ALGARARRGSAAAPSRVLPRSRARRVAPVRRVPRAGRRRARPGPVASRPWARATTRGGGAMGGMIGRALENIRHGRAQKLLSLATAVSAPGLAFEIYLEHYKASFGDKWMWTPIVLTPPLTAAGVAGYFSERAARTWLPLFGALYALDGVIGIAVHVRGVQRKPGGFAEPTY